MKHKTRFVRHLILGALLATTAAAFQRDASAGNMPAVGTATAAVINVVNIKDFSFQPAVLTVKAGATVIWTNRDSTPHTIASADKRFASSAGLDTGDQYSVKFDKPGSYEYFCSLHAMMVGKVIVQP